MRVLRLMKPWGGEFKMKGCHVAAHRHWRRLFIHTMTGLSDPIERSYSGSWDASVSHAAPCQQQGPAVPHALLRLREHWGPPHPPAPHLLLVVRARLVEAALQERLLSLEAALPLGGWEAKGGGEALADAGQDGQEGQ
jgi:hypothetical protein